MDERNIKIAKVLRSLGWTFLIGAGVLVVLYLCFFLYSSIPMALNTRVTSVEYSQQYGPWLRTYFPRSGYTLLLVEVDSSADDNLSFGYGSELSLVDRQGHSYPMIGEYSGKYIFEIPPSAEHLRLRLPWGSTIKVESPEN